MPAGKCRICGCTDMEGCSVGCSWIQDDLCSVCADVGVAIVSLFAARTRARIVEQVLRDGQIAELVEEGDCDEKRVRRALADLVKHGAIEKVERGLYDIPGGG